MGEIFEFIPNIERFYQQFALDEVVEVDVPKKRVIYSDGSYNEVPWKLELARRQEKDALQLSSGRIIPRQYMWES